MVIVQVVWFLQGTFCRGVKARQQTSTAVLQGVSACWLVYVSFCKSPAVKACINAYRWVMRAGDFANQALPSSLRQTQLRLT